MNTLPFVWELEHEGLVSHAIGSPAVRSMPSPQNYTQDIVHYLDGKDLIFIESSVPRGGSLEAVVRDIAHEKELTIRCVSASHESDIFYAFYAPCIDNAEAADAYKKGDEAKLKELYGDPIKSHIPINNNIAVRSLRFIKAVPTLLVANLAHFLVEPTLLSMYEKQKIKVKRIQ